MDKEASIQIFPQELAVIGHIAAGGVFFWNGDRAGIHISISSHIPIGRYVGMTIEQNVPFLQHRKALGIKVVAWDAKMLHPLSSRKQ